MATGPVAVLDANVLFPFQLRNFLLHLAAEGLFEPLWSEEIVEECMRSLRARSAMSAEQCAHLVQQMRAYFPEAWGTGHTGRAEGLHLPDENDRHVVALAAHFEAEYIVTRNVRHFPAPVLRALAIQPVSPDRFALHLWERAPAAVLRAAERHRCSLRRDPLAPIEYLASLRQRAEIPQIVERLKSAGFLEARPQVE